MVRVHTIIRGLLVATVAVAATSVRADDASTQSASATCVAPEVVSSYETKIDQLETERAQWQSQLVAANGQWSEQKSALEAQLEGEQSAQKKARKELEKARAETAETVASLEQQLRESAAQHAETLEQLKTQVATLEQTVDELKSQLKTQNDALAKREAEASDAQAKLVKSQNQVKSLERDVASSQKKNKALRDELEKVDENLSMSALLSSYYDEGVVLAADAVSALRDQLESAQEGSAGVAQTLEALETYRTKLAETTGQLYAEHLAATLDPVLADFHRTSQPYIKQYRPLLEAELARAQTLLIQNYNLALKRGKAARADAIVLLEQTEGVAPYAQKIVDASLVVLLAPIAYLVLRLVLSLVWFMVRTVLWVVTLGFCCGRCSKKRSKLKRKASRKPVPAVAAASPASVASTSSTTKKASPASGNGKRASGKKQK